MLKKQENQQKILDWNVKNVVRDFDLRIQDMELQNVQNAKVPILI